MEGKIHDGFNQEHQERQRYFKYLQSMNAYHHKVSFRLNIYLCRKEEKNYTWQQDHKNNSCLMQFTLMKTRKMENHFQMYHCLELKLYQESRAYWALS